LGTAAASLLLAAATTRGSLPCSLAAIAQRSSDAHEQGTPSISADGRFLAFASRGRLLSSVAGTESKVYVLDLMTQTLTMESSLSSGSLPGDSRAPSISGDGRMLAFEWAGTPTDAGAPAPHTQIMLRDRLLETTRMISVNDSGVPGDHDSSNPVLSADGGVVAFESSATNLVAGTDVNGQTRDVYVVLVATGATSRASVDGGGLQREAASFSPSLSAGGRYLAFTSDARLDDATTPAPARGNAAARTRHVFVRDLARGVTRRISRRPDGREPNGASFLPAISGDGRWVVFVSNATDIVRGHLNAVSNIYLHDLQTSTTTLVSRSADGAASDGASTRAALSASGRFVVFESEASNLVCGKRCRPPDWDINLLTDVFVFDRDDRSIVRLSSDPHSGWMEPSGSPAVDASGRVVVFTSRHPIARDDIGNDFDVFVASRCGTD
jgi:Tol biopolymer transport system component